MKRYRGTNIAVDWYDDELILLVGKTVDEVTKIGAEIVLERARRNLEIQGAVDTGRLVDQIDVRVSKFAHGGYAVVAQGPGNYGPKRSPTDSPYYASFIELGGHYSLWGRYGRRNPNRPYFEGRPYLRPAIKQAGRVYKRLMVKALKGSLADD